MSKRAKSKGRRKKLAALAGLLIALVAIVAALPWWWPWVLRPIGQRYGLTFGAYEREGYARFVLREVGLTNASTHFRAKRVEGLVPTVWLWRRWRGAEDAAYFRVLDWELGFPPRARKANAPLPSVYRTFQTTENAVAEVLKWLPRAEWIDGVIGLGRGSIQLPRVAWAGGELQASVTRPELPGAGSLRARLKAMPYEIQADFASLGLRSMMQISEDARGLTLQTTNLWLTNRFEASARFGRNGVRPETARVEAGSFTVPVSLLGMEMFRNVTGALSFSWETNRYALHLAAGAQPLSADIPPVECQVRASGDFDSAFIDQARISMPWIQAELTEKTRVQFASPFFTNEVSLKLFVNLGGQPWFPAEGQLRGEARFAPGSGRVPPMAFAVSGADVQLGNIQTRKLALRAALQWPWLDLTNAQLDFVDQSVATVAGRLNLETRTVQEGIFSLAGQFGQQWLPVGVAYDRATLVASCRGPFRQLTNAGTLTVHNLSAPHLQASNLTANWRGENATIADARIAVAAKNTSLVLEGSADFAGPEKRMQFRTLTLRQSGDAKLALRQPFQVTFRPGPGPRGWSLGMQPLAWSGEGGRFSLEGGMAWPDRGQVAGSVGSLDSGLFADFLKPRLQRWELGELHFSCGWSNGPMHLDLQLARLALEVDGVALSAAGTVRGDEKGLSLQQLLVSRQQKPVATANGFLPIALHPARTNVLQVNLGEPVQLDVMVQPEAFFWNQLADSWGVGLQQPELQAHLSGTWREPQGKIQLRANQLKLKRVEREVPPLEDFAIDLQIKPEIARLDSLTFAVARQPVMLTGQIPLPNDFWTRLPRKPPIPDWRKATGRLQIDRAQVAALSPFFTDLLAPGGIITANVSLLPDGQLGGGVTVDGVNTRPLENVGVLRQIEAVLSFEGRKIHLKSAASIGGQLARAIGHTDLSQERWRKGDGLPPFQIQISGSNIPLTRRVEAIVRADVNLAVTNAPRQAPVISGAVRLRNSMYFQELTALVPDGPVAPRRRPPYFSIDRHPFAAWRLHATVTGDDFLKLRTPLFRGGVSANVLLQGTLQDPMVIGEVRIDSGSVRLPFASLPVTQGFINLTSENPYQPQLFVTAAARVFGYEVKMEITGAANHPVIQFSSTPPLTSEQILLMVMAGELPRSDQTLSGQERAQRMALFLGRNVLSELGILGDAERLTIRSGENISNTGKPTYSVEYKITDDWAIVGEYDRFNDYNLMLQWRVYPW